MSVCHGKRGNLGRLSQDVKRRRISLSGEVSSQPSTCRDIALARNETSSDDFETISNERQGSTANVCLFSSQPSTSRERMARFRAKQSELERAERRTRDRDWHKLSRATQSQEDRDIRRDDQRVRQEQRRQMETEEERAERREDDRVRHSLNREIETEEKREARRDDLSTGLVYWYWHRKFNSKGNRRRRWRYGSDLGNQFRR